MNYKSNEYIIVYTANYLLETESDYYDIIKDDVTNYLNSITKGDIKLIPNFDKVKIISNADHIEYELWIKIKGTISIDVESKDDTFGNAEINDLIKRHIYLNTSLEFDNILDDNISFKLM